MRNTTLFGFGSTAEEIARGIDLGSASSKAGRLERIAPELIA